MVQILGVLIPSLVHETQRATGHPSEKSQPLVLIDLRSPHRFVLNEVPSVEFETHLYGSDSPKMI